jgi:L-lactate dehydrogenase
MTEVLSQVLGGYGRSDDRPESELNSIYLQVLDPLALADPRDYDREIRHLVQIVEGSRPDDPERPVRMPGRNAWMNRAAQIRDGVLLDPGVLDALAPRAKDAGLELPPRLA